MSAHTAPHRSGRQTIGFARVWLLAVTLFVGIPGVASLLVGLIP